MQSNEPAEIIEILSIASVEGKAMMREFLKFMQRGLMFGVLTDESQGVYVVPCRALNLINASERKIPGQIDHEKLVVRNLCNDGLIGTGPFPDHTGLYGDYRRAIWHSTPIISRMLVY